MAAFGVETEDDIGSGRQCSFCMKTYVNKTNYKKHLQAQHIFGKKSEQYKCLKCPLVTFDRREFLTHLNLEEHFPAKLGFLKPKVILEPYPDHAYASKNIKEGPIIPPSSFVTSEVLEMTENLSNQEAQMVFPSDEINMREIDLT